MTTQAETKIPDKFLPFLGEYGGHLKDHASKEIIGYGYPITGTLGEDMWKELSAFGKQIFDPKAKLWYLIVYSLTREQAIAKYGPVTHEEYGPRGGWKSVTFGTTKFDNAIFKPAPKTETPAAEPAKKVTTIRIID